MERYITVETEIFKEDIKIGKEKYVCQSMCFLIYSSDSPLCMRIF